MRTNYLKLSIAISIFFLLCDNFAGLCIHGLQQYFEEALKLPITEGNRPNISGVNEQNARQNVLDGYEE